MNTTTTWHTIRQASLISGLPESTLRYYEQIGIIPPITRDPSSGHRIYNDQDIELLNTIACLNATGMPLNDMREYLHNTQQPTQNPQRQIELLDQQALNLAAKAETIRIQQAYVAFKTLYWQTIANGHPEQAQQLIHDNQTLIQQTKRLQTNH